MKLPGNFGLTVEWSICYSSDSSPKHWGSEGKHMASRFGVSVMWQINLSDDSR